MRQKTNVIGYGETEHDQNPPECETDLVHAEEDRRPEQVDDKLSDKRPPAIAIASLDLITSANAINV